MEIKIRFNTDKDKINNSLPPWRVIIDGTEHFAEKVIIKTASWTTFDEISPGKHKWHITCVGKPEWNLENKECMII
jgi:hypothetical protein